MLSVSAAAEPEAPTALHNLSPTVKHETMNGTSHWMQMDQPQAFNAILDAFLRDVRQAPAGGSIGGAYGIETFSAESSTSRTLRVNTSGVNGRLDDPANLRRASRHVH